MISNIHTSYLKGEKAFNSKKFAEAKKHLISVVEHDKNHYAAYLLLFEILNKSHSSFLKVVVNELKRLNPELSLHYKTAKPKKKNNAKPNNVVTISYVKLMIQQGKKIKAKKSLRSIIRHSKTKKQISEAEELLNMLN
tara:strand:+ start:966 stop:1379 length:414 start_codon:yes stop_codon:yes gene_type:complete